MDNDSAPPANRPMKDTVPQKTWGGMTPEEQGVVTAEDARRKVVYAFRAAQSQAKRTSDKVRKEVEVAQKLAPKLSKEKNLPKETEDHFMSFLIPLMTSANELLEAWGENAKKDVIKEPDDALDVARSSLEKLTNGLDTAYTSVNGTKIKSLKVLTKRGEGEGSRPRTIDGCSEAERERGACFNAPRAPPLSSRPPAPRRQRPGLLEMFVNLLWLTRFSGNQEIKKLIVMNVSKNLITWSPTRIVFEGN